VRTERDIAAGFLHGDADLGLEPLAVFIHERDHGNGGFADVGGEFGQIVEDFLRHSVEHIVLPEHVQTLLFVFWNGRAHAL